MRCNPSRWLWGLIPVALLAWGTYQRERPVIEADLTRRAEAALADAGQTWANVRFSGRDAVITGRAQKDGEPKAALDVVRSLWGVRRVQLRTDIAVTEAPARLTAAGDGADMFVAPNDTLENVARPGSIAFKVYTD